MKPRFEEFALKEHETPRFLYQYYVTGSCTFPYDMMRYDHCWPATGLDAELMVKQHWQEGFNKTRSIKMHSYREPTVARWSSFLWSVGTENLMEKTDA